MDLGDTEFFYSGRNDELHRQGAVLMIYKEAVKSCLG